MARRLSDSQIQRMGVYGMALNLKNVDWEQFKKAGVNASKEFIKASQRAVVQLAKAKVGVKTGRTRASIQVWYEPKYTKGGIKVDSWLGKWIDNGGGSYNHSKDKTTYNFDESLVKRGTRNYRKWFHHQAKNKRVRSTAMLSSHPANYLYRPAKQLLAAYKSQKTLERYMKLYMKSVEIKDYETVNRLERDAGID